MRHLPWMTLLFACPRLSDPAPVPERVVQPPSIPVQQAAVSQMPVTPVLWAPEDPLDDLAWDLIAQEDRWDALMAEMNFDAPREALIWASPPDEDAAWDRMAERQAPCGAADLDLVDVDCAEPPCVGVFVGSRPLTGELLQPGDCGDLFDPGAYTAERQCPDGSSQVVTVIYELSEDEIADPEAPGSASRFYTRLQELGAEHSCVGF